MTNEESARLLEEQKKVCIQAEGENKEKGVCMDKKILWRRDQITDEWREEHKKELSIPLEKLSPGFLGEAITYCCNGVIGNPFAEEIIRQAGCMEEYRKAYFRKDKIRIFDKACELFGFHLY